MSTEVKVAVIGCGHWGKNLIRKFSGLGVLACVNDVNADAANAVASEFDTEVWDLDQIMRSPEISAVIVASLAQSHTELCLAALKAGKHVFVEKPIALTREDAIAIKDEAVKQGLTLMVGHLLQYHPVFLEMKRVVEAGDLGNLRHIYSRRLNLGKLRTHENVLWSFAPHDISMILGLTGKAPQTVSSFSSCYLQDNISDVHSLDMAFDDNLTAQVTVSWINPIKEQRLVVIGDKAMAVFDDLQPWENKLMVYDHVAEIRDGMPVVERADGRAIVVPEEEPLLNECRHFLEYICTGERPITDADEAIRVLDILLKGK
jgi:predicted dehydrogenase